LEILVKAAAKRAGLEASQRAVERGGDPTAAYSNAAAHFSGLRFHDLRHLAITEFSENGAPDATIMALAGHLSKAMLKHYSHVRMEAKRTAVDALGTGLPSLQNAHVQSTPPAVQ
jgi:integrase